MNAPAAGSSLAPTERLAKLVLAGEVVFFIGAGFSVDSEGNSAARLIARLLARLLAMGHCLERIEERNAARTVLGGLDSVFGLGGAKRTPSGWSQPSLCMTADNVKLLAREYYSFNAWAASALGELSREMIGMDAHRRDTIAERINKLENFLLSSLGSDAVPLEPVEWHRLSCLKRDVDLGKALFLDTMGFTNTEIMGGLPRAADIARVAESYGTRLYHRHHALARLAREGLLPFVVTTNYDLLLEGAYRLAGFAERQRDNDDRVDFGGVPRTSIAVFSRIAGADQFFSRGEGYRTALLLKIHGCVESYRDARAESLSDEDPVPEAWAGYLPALVFTYREIQTWRADAWSRDLIRTLLRTHTLALCGYSGADPVMHSTIRDVYEEMARSRLGRSPRMSKGSDSRGAKAEADPTEDAPAFVFSIAGKREFPSLEILRAATEATGFSVSALEEHRNQIPFETAPDAFPTLDDHFRWLTHCALREIQAQALETRVRGLAPRLLQDPCADADHSRLCASFAELRAQERDLVTSTGDSRKKRRAFESVVGWTWHFLPGFLRELALAELVVSQQGPGRTVSSVRCWPWYFPATERPEWAAWAAVLELALRRMVEIWRGPAANALSSDFEWITPEESPHAVISFSRNVDQRQPLALCVRLAGFERPGHAPLLNGAFRRVTTWELGEQDVPWPIGESGRCPGARELWSYAIGRSFPKGNVAYRLGALDG